MNGHIADQFIDECLPPLPALLGSGALDTLRQFHDSDDGKTNLDISLAGSEMFQDLPDGVAPALAVDHHAGIEDQAHVGGFHGLRLRTISSTSAPKSGSGTGA
jgi:hypothetical protein